MNDCDATVLYGEVLPAPNAKRYALAQRAHKLIVTHIAEAERHSILAGRALVQLKDRHLYRELGFDTFGAYLASPEVHLSRSEAGRKLALGRAFPGDGRFHPDATFPRAGQSAPPLDPARAVPVSDEQLAAVGERKAALLLPVLRADPEQTAEWLAKAEAQPEGDLQLSVREAQEGPLSARAEFALEMSRKLYGFAASIRDASALEETLDELIALLQTRRAYLAALAATDRPYERSHLLRRGAHGVFLHEEPATMFDPHAADLLSQLDDLDRVGAFIAATTAADREEFLRQIPDLCVRDEAHFRLWRAAARGGRPPMSEGELASLVGRLVRGYPQIDDVILVGNRGVRTARPDDDVELLIVLDPSQYEEEPPPSVEQRWTWGRFRPRDRIEQRIAFDPDCQGDGLIVCFWRPDAEVAHWGSGPDGPAPTTLPIESWDPKTCCSTTRTFDPATAEPWDPDWELWVSYTRGALLDPKSVWREKRWGRILYCRWGWVGCHADYAD